MQPPLDDRGAGIPGRTGVGLGRQPPQKRVGVGVGETVGGDGIVGDTVAAVVWVAVGLVPTVAVVVAVVGCDVSTPSGVALAVAVAVAVGVAALKSRTPIAPERFIVNHGFPSGPNVMPAPKSDPGSKLPLGTEISSISPRGVMRPS